MKHSIKLQSDDTNCKSQVAIGSFILRMWSMKKSTFSSNNVYKWFLKSLFKSSSSGFAFSSSFKLNFFSIHDRTYGRHPIFSYLLKNYQNKSLWDKNLHQVDHATTWYCCRRSYSKILHFKEHTHLISQFNSLPIS